MSSKPHSPNLIPGQEPEPSKLANVSLCIVTNTLDARLEAVVAACEGHFTEILIGYNGAEQSIPHAFTGNSRLRLIPVVWLGFGATKNKLAEAAVCPWVLSLDSDEIPDEAMLAAVAALPLHELSGREIFALKRISFFEGHKIMHGAWGRDQVLRLYHKQYTQWDYAAVHEDLTQHSETTISRLPGILYHYTADSYAVFLEKNKRYARLSADKYFATGKKSPLWKRLLSPGFTFWKEYLVLGGFLDGAAGLHIARANALYTRWKYQYLHEKYQERESSS